ncbi:MAG: hypothetical protein GY870_12640 [archaeon]|nr:hypothetical protein [archaeon]
MNKKEKKILKYLHDNGSTSIIDLKKAIKVTDKMIWNLMRQALIYNFYTENSFDEKYCHYELSKTGRKIINS